MKSESAGLRPLFLSTNPVTVDQVRLAQGAVLVSIAIFLAVAPLATTPIAVVPAFIPIYESALVTCDAITAILLFGQFAILRSRALCVLASGYLFTATITVAHALTFPGLFSPTGLLGAGVQTTAALFAFWHDGFPMFVIAYALFKGGPSGVSAIDGAPVANIRGAIFLSIAAVLALVLAIVLFVTLGHQYLPAIMQGGRISDHGQVALASGWILSLIAFVVLWRRGPHSILDLWLMVVMWAWCFDIALSANLNGARFDLGWYGGRIYGLLAASFVLAVILGEYSRHYARLARVSAELHDANHAIEQMALRNLAHLETQHLLEIQKEMNRGLERSSRMKTEFLATMSHELRTPLNAIIGFSEALKDGLVGKTTDAQNEYITDIFTSGRHLLALINEILDLSKVEAGTMELDIAPVHLNTLLAGSLAIVRSRAAAHCIVLELETAGTQGIYPLDTRKTKQIVFNLLSNAVKFSADGGRVTLRSSRVARARVGLLGGHWPVHSLQLPENEYAEFLEISVTDSGIGISRQDMAQLFQPFTQIDSGLSRKFEGTGLGLAMVKLLAELHGGTVAVASAVGEGACFAVWLPLRAEAAPTADAQRPLLIPA